MKATSLSLPTAALALLTTVIFAVSTVAQAPQAPPQGPGARPRNYPPPKNLKVLPKTLTGQQVHEIMEGWAGSLGVHCDNCHQADPTRIGPNGRPMLKFEDDSKPEKDKARLMYKMTQDINENYVSMLPETPGHTTGKVTCGTCHRGNKDPQEFVPPPMQMGPGGPPPGGAPPARPN